MYKIINFVIKKYFKEIDLRFLIQMLKLKKKKIGKLFLKYKFINE